MTSVSVATFPVIDNPVLRDAVAKLSSSGTLTDRSWTPSEGMDFEDVAEVGAAVAAMRIASEMFRSWAQWVAGDWVNALERRDRKDQWPQIVRITGYSDDRLYTLSWVCRRWAAPDRRPWPMTFGHHEAVSAADIRSVAPSILDESLKVFETHGITTSTNDIKEVRNRYRLELARKEETAEVVGDDGIRSVIAVPTAVPVIEAPGNQTLNMVQIETEVTRAVERFASEAGLSVSRESARLLGQRMLVWIGRSAPDEVIELIETMRSRNRVRP